MSQPALLLEVEVRPPWARCLCGSLLRWHEHRVSDGEITWTLHWAAQCRCGTRITWRP